MAESPFHRFKRAVESRDQDLTLAFSGNNYVPLSVIEQNLKAILDAQIQLQSQTPTSSGSETATGSNHNNNNNNSNNSNKSQQHKQQIPTLLGWAVLSIYGHCVDYHLSSTIPVSSAITYWDEVLHSGPMGLSLYMVQNAPFWIADRLWDAVGPTIKSTLGSHSAESQLQSRSKSKSKPHYSAFSLSMFHSPLFVKLRPKSWQDILYMANPGYAAVKKDIKTKRDEARAIKKDIARSLGALVKHSFNLDGPDSSSRRASDDSINAGAPGTSDGPRRHMTRTNTGLESRDDLLDTVAVTAHAILRSLGHVVDHNDSDRGAADSMSMSVGRSSRTQDITRQLLQITAILRLHPHNEQVRTELCAHKCGKPSWLARWWPAAIIGVYELYRFLGNLPAIVEWFQTRVVDTAQLFWENWIVGPLRNVYETVRHDDQAKIALMSKQSLSSDMSSLERMVIQFAHDYKDESTAGLTDEILRTRVQSGDMSAVLVPYEKQIQTPISSLLKGQLVRSLLIQIQKTKVDVEVAMDGIDKLLQSQQLVFGLVAALPAIAVSWFSINSLVNRSQQGNIRKKAQDRGQTKERVLASLGEVERVLTKYSDASSSSSSLQDLGLGLVLCETHFVRVVSKAYLSTSRYRQLCQDLQSFETTPTWPALDRIYIHGYFN